MKATSLYRFKEFSDEDQKQISEKVVSEICKIIKEGYSPSIAIRHTNRTLRICYGLIYHICARSETYVNLVEEVRTERKHRHTKFMSGTTPIPKFDVAP